MQSQILVFSFLLLCAIFAGRIALRRGRVRRRGNAEESSLWMGLAAGLFEAEDSPVSSRMEIALKAIAKKLGLRAAMVTRHDRNHCAVIASAAETPQLLRGLERGSVVARSSLFCGSVRDEGSSLAIDYASLSEWRAHGALRERGWESYLGVACGSEGLVVSFFDSRPRPAPFTRAERTLAEQLGPWISSMVAAETARSAPTLPVLDTQRES